MVPCGAKWGIPALGSEEDGALPRTCTLRIHAKCVDYDLQTSVNFCLSLALEHEPSHTISRHFAGRTGAIGLLLVKPGSLRADVYSEGRWLPHDAALGREIPDGHSQIGSPSIVRCLDYRFLEVEGGVQ
jgi:hypothetical protein